MLQQVHERYQFCACHYIYEFLTSSGIFHLTNVCICVFFSIKAKEIQQNYGVGRVDVPWVAIATVTPKLLQVFFLFFLKLFKIHKPCVVLSFRAMR